MQIFVINLPSAIERRKFQQDQLTKLGLEYKILDATSSDDISDATYKKHYFDWQRPLRKTEIACYYSHRLAWEMVTKSRKPALILEDDAVLSSCVPELLDNLNEIDNSDLINLENRSRKKFVSRSYIEIDCNSKLYRLYQDRTGAAGYILWPSGANKLIQLEKNSGIGLADAHITACHKLKAYQVEPSPIIQLDQCNLYGINNTLGDTVSKSTVNVGDKYKASIYFMIKRALYQLKLALRQLFILTKSQRRYIKIRNSDFNV
mgnify:CR=1 FL=1